MTSVDVIVLHLHFWSSTSSLLIRKPPLFDNVPIEEPSSEILSLLACTIENLGCHDEDSQLEVLLPPKSLCGKIINVVIWEDSHWNFIRRSIANHHLAAGSFIHLRNVQERRLFQEQGNTNTPRGMFDHFYGYLFKSLLKVQTLQNRLVCIC